MLHLCKVAVGVRDAAHLRTIQAARACAHPPLRHLTRNMPRRADEILAGGSIYWLLGGVMSARQPILGIAPARREDGGACTALLLDPSLVAVSPRVMKPFQGWRYLPGAEAPPDLEADERVPGWDALPPALFRQLRALCLL